MADDLIVVDDFEPHSPSASSNGAGAYSQPAPSTPMSVSLNGPATRRRVASIASAVGIVTGAGADSMERTTRSISAARNRPAPKLKLKLNEKAAAQAAGVSFLGAYDRELDSDDEDLTFEEQFILRMPPGEDCERLRKTVAAREAPGDVWFKFKDSRRAVFHSASNTYSAKLVDLPCIIESQKTLDNKQMFKVADICQMLVVGDRIDGDQAVGTSRTFNIDEFIWPHGVTPPLHWVRKRRFRKRANKRTIESVEQEVERLLEADAAAEQIRYDVLENVNPDLSDSEFVEREEALDAPTPGFAGSEMGDAPTPAADLEGGDGDADGSDEDEGDEPEGDIDEELAAELDLALGDDEGEEEEEDEEESEEEDEDDEDEEGAQERNLLSEEIRDLQAAVAKKDREIASSSNPLIKKRFEDALKKLRADLDMKLAQMDDVKEQQRLRKEGIASEEGGNTDADGDGADEQEDDLFGPDDSMEIG